MPAPRIRSKCKQSPFRYHWAALQYGTLTLLPLGGLALATLSVPFGIALMVLGEVLVVFVPPRVDAFRRYVDADIERAAAIDVRRGVLELMTAVHRADFEQLERLAAGIRMRCRSTEAQATTDPTVERWLGLDKLVSLYAELAITHRRNVEAFRAEDWGALVVQSARVNERLSTPDGSTDPWAHRRRDILRLRRETWRRATNERDAIAQDLATITDVVQWMHELCDLVPGDSARSRVEDALESWESNGATLREVASLRRAGDNDIDPTMLALGREVMTRAASSPALQVTTTPPTLLADVAQAEPSAS